jgi:hypothetical protein
MTKGEHLVKRTGEAKLEINRVNCLYRTRTFWEEDLDFEKFSVADQKAYQITKTKET